MKEFLMISTSLIMMGVSFLIMSLGCITNKYIIYIGLLLAIASVILFLVGGSNLIFVDKSNFGG